MPRGRPPRDPEDRFWEKVVIPEDSDDCWLWIAARNTHNYGAFWDGTRQTQAHQFLWEHLNGAVPEGMCVCHSCDVRYCVNPDHLFLGTQGDNIQDMIAKGRKAPTFGEYSGNAKVTDEIVRSMRREYAAAERKWGMKTKLARKYGISQPQASVIINRKAWKHVRE